MSISIPRPPKRIFPSSRVEAQSAEHVTSMPADRDPAYQLAFQDMDFLLREDLRPVRFQLELLKPELLLDEANIASTFVFYGSARIPEPAKADALIAAASTDEPAPRSPSGSRPMRKYYDEARELARLASRVEPDEDGKRHFVVCSGGGPSIMEAANRGAADEGQGIDRAQHRPAARADCPIPMSRRAELPVPLFRAEEDALPAARAGGGGVPGGFGTFDESVRAADPDPDRQGQADADPVLRPRILGTGDRFRGAGRGRRDLARRPRALPLCEDAEEAWDCVSASMPSIRSRRGASGPRPDPALT